MEVLRRTCRIQLQKLREAVHVSFPADTRMSSPRGGYLLWVQLPRGLDCRLLFDAAIEEGIALMPGTLFSLTGKYRNFIRLSAGVEWSQEIEDAVARIGVLATRFLAEALKPAQPSGGRFRTVATRGRARRPAAAATTAGQRGKHAPDGA